MMAFETTFTVAWGDCDPGGIVFYPRFFIGSTQPPSAGSKQTSYHKSSFKIVMESLAPAS